MLRLEGVIIACLDCGADIFRDITHPREYLPVEEATHTDERGYEHTVRIPGGVLMFKEKDHYCEYRQGLTC